MNNNTTAAFLTFVAALTVYGGINHLMSRRPVTASIAAVEIWFGLTLIYIGLNMHVII